ncbi:hypothetical protein BDW67DRAFT_183083 [Aspergillus spinulosporus]
MTTSTILTGSACSTSFNAKVLQGLEAEEQMDLLASHQLSVIEDPTKLDGATSHQVREHFILWAQTELTRVLKDPSRRTYRMHGPNCIEYYPLEGSIGTGYNFCLFVNETCLESLDETPRRPVVKILLRDWGNPAPEDYHSNVYSLNSDHGYEDGMTNDPEEDVG